MKARIAAVLSITGVLVAGSAAALVNTQVLSATPTSSGNNVVLDDSTSLPGTSVSGTSLPGDTSSTVPSATTGAPASTQAVYQVGDAGFVTLDTAGERLTIVSATPQPGWAVVKAENEDSLNVEVKFQSASVEVEFHANLLFGVVGTSVETKNLSSGTGGTTVSTPGGGSSSVTVNTTGNSIDDDDDSDDDSDDDEDNSGHGGDDDSSDDSDDDSGHGGSEDD